MPATSTPGDVMRQEIIAKPDDDGLRLIYADWLEDNGQVDYASWIRAQIHTARLYAAGCSPDSYFSSSECEILSTQPALLAVAGEHINHSWRTSTGACHVLFHSQVEVVYFKGFIECVYCPILWWLAHGREIALVHPLRNVSITNRRPFENGLPNAWAWWFGCADESFVADSKSYALVSQDYLPMSLIRLMPGADDKTQITPFDSAKKATRALSEACVLWARREG